MFDRATQTFITLFQSVLERLLHRQLQGLLRPVRGQMYYKRFISDWVAVRPTVSRAGRQRCLAMQRRFVAALTTYQ